MAFSIMHLSRTQGSLAIQAPDEQIMRLRWLHTLRVKDMRTSAAEMEAFRDHHNEKLNIPEALHLESLNKLALLAAQAPGQNHIPPEVVLKISSGLDSKA